MAIILVSAYVGMAYVLSDAGQNYRDAKQALQKGVESRHIPTATNQLPSKDKLYVVYFTADWCTPCKLMKPYWKHKTIQDQLKKYKGTKSGKTYKPYKVYVDVEKNILIIKKYKVTGIPCIILVTNDGVEWARSVGGLSLSELKAFLSKGAVSKRTNNDNN